MKRAICILIASFFLFPTTANAVSAESYILIDADSGKALYEHNADEKKLIASTTKIMTALVALEQGNLDDEVKISPEAANVEGSSMYLKAGETKTLEELIYGMMLVSGNDAATAIACHIAGNTQNFAELMNSKAKEIGVKNTSFTNPHGLDHENHYSTARDMALIMAKAMKNEDFARITSTKSITIDDLTYRNHNKLLSNCDGVIGGKTGYTKAAGRTLVTCCERKGLRLICVTLNDPDDWDDHMAMYDKAYSEFKKVTVSDSNMDYAEIPVISGEDCTLVSVRAAKSVTILVGADDEVEITVELPKFVYADVSEGDSCGKVIWTVNGEKSDFVELIYTKSVERQSSEEKGLLEKIKEHIQGIIEYNLNKFGYYGS